MSNLALRIIFGAVYVAIMVLATVAGSPYFGVLMALLAFLSLNEMANIAKKSSIQHLWLNPTVFAGLILYLTFVGAREMNIVAFLILWILQLVSLYFSYLELNKRQRVNYISTTMYLFLPLVGLAIWFMQNTAFNVNYILFYFVTIWLYDSMAYVVGKQIGKNPIFPTVSPKKTIEGTAGGAIVTVVIMTILNHYLFHLPVAPYIIAVVIVFFATFGDFVESYMKRKTGIKDSGNLIPGHGGILDRIDSIYLSAIPYIVILLFL